LLLALVCGGLSGSAFAVKPGDVQRTHHRHFRWLLLESDVPAVARIAADSECRDQSPGTAAHSG
jgi:hypothetical protein